MVIKMNFDMKLKMAGKIIIIMFSFFAHRMTNGHKNLEKIQRIKKSILQVIFMVVALNYSNIDQKQHK